MRLELDLVLVMALQGGELSVLEWFQLARELGLRTTKRKQLNRAQVAKLAHELADARVIVESPGYVTEYMMTTGQVLLCLEDAHREGRLTEMWRQVELAKRWDRPWCRDAAWSTTSLRIGLVQSDSGRVDAALGQVESPRTKRQRKAHGCWLLRCMGLAPKPSWLELIGEGATDLYLAELLDASTQQLVPLGDDVRQHCDRPSVRFNLARHLCVNGNAEAARALEVTKPQAHEIACLSHFFAGDFAGALAAGEAGVMALPKSNKRRAYNGLTGVCHALLRACDTTKWGALGRSIRNTANDDFDLVYQALEFYMTTMRQGAPKDAADLDDVFRGYEMGWPHVLGLGLVYSWLGVRANWLHIEVTHILHVCEHVGGFQRLRFELQAILDTFDGKPPPKGSLAAYQNSREPWEIALDALETLAIQPEQTAKKKKESRISWQVDFTPDAITITPRLVSGRGKIGKAVSLAKMIAGNIEATTDHDRKILACVTYVAATPWARTKRTPTLQESALLELVDHPHIIGKDGSPLTFTKGKPRLRVESADDDVLVRIEPPGLASSPFECQETSPGRYLVYERTDEIERIVRAMGTAALRLPQHAAERIGKVIGALGSRIEVSAGAGVEISGEERPTDSKPLLLLNWDGAIFRADVRAAPLGIAGPHLQIAEGGTTIASVVDGTPVRTTRDYEAERANLVALLEQCPALASLYRNGQVQTFDLHTALEILLELEPIEFVSLAWPRGQRLATPSTRGVADWRINVGESSDWLTVDAQLSVDEDSVIGFCDLLQRRDGRFIALEGEKFIALTSDLQERIDALESLGNTQKKGLVASPIVLPLVRDLTEGSQNLTLDSHCKKRLARIERAVASKPRVPKSFLAELRDYQREGFVWMARLAEAGLGGCLADDMGLGKTIQTMGLLVSRAKRGPALVVAPTSVAANWKHELHRFAPTLHPLLLNEGDREQTFGQLGAKDVLICSYGLLVTELERLANVDFHMVVFDEAHYLKNPRTKRAKAARELKCPFRLALTGTPIENHLGELWSLMESITPGLLGSEKHFETRFAAPIRDGDRDRARQLRALLRPFLLRRTKAQVLDELPERTEVTLRIEPTDHEAAFYEALRRRALQQVDDGDGDSRFQILAHITRLRQAAVDPRLIADDGPAGAKVATLIKRVKALADEGHRALVFSQFLGGMRHVCEGLTKEGIHHLTLDGSTPTKERTKRIAAFQDGEGDVFVMSLKAGGVGVNLTGADYVMHLDPWWNPAVEEQATARSHRIGQKRPVTVYRFVTAGTIEEKILLLHRDKRELASDLLGNMDRAKKLDLEELKALL